MGYLLRNAKKDDLRSLLALSSQFTLLNLPNSPDILAEKIDRSEKSFSKQLQPSESEYLFVVEETDSGRIVGSSLIIGKHGTPQSPHVYFKILKREKFSRDLGIGFVHQVLQFCEEKNGPTEIGGLLVDFEHRRIPDKIGKQISLIRFLFMGMNINRIETRLLCELSPPLTSEGRSEFWEAIGRRFTGLNYQEADRLSQTHKEFIKSLFPQEEIYTSILPSSARLVLGRISDATRPAQHLLEKLGFYYLNEIDPFDGGPHYGVETKNVPLIQNTRAYSVGGKARRSFEVPSLIAIERDGAFLGCQTPCDFESDTIYIPDVAKKLIGVEDGERVFQTTLIF